MVRAILAALCALSATSCPEPAPMIFTKPAYELDLGDQVAASPTVSPEGHLYVVTYHGRVLKIVDPGTVSARVVKLADLDDTCVFPPVLGGDGSVYVNSGTGRAYRVADEGARGRVVWKAESDAPRTVDHVLELGADTVFVHYSRYEEIVAYDRATGTRKYEVSVEAPDPELWGYGRGAPGMLASSGLPGVELIVGVATNAVLLVGPDGGSSLAKMGVLYPTEPPETFTYKSIDFEMFDGPGGPRALGVDTSVGLGASDSRYAIRKISSSWTDADDVILDTSGLPPEQLGFAFRYLGGGLLEGRSYGVNPDGSYTVLCWNVSDGSLARSYDLRIERSDAAGSFYSPQNPVVYHSADGSPPWVLFGTQRSQMSYVIDRFAGRYNQSDPYAAIPREIALPDSPMVAEPVMVRNMLVLAFADGTLAGFAAASGPLL